MLFQVEALLENLSDAGTAVDLATQAAFKDLRSRTLKQKREAFATQAGKGNAQKKIAWQDVRTHSPALLRTGCRTDRHLLQISISFVQVEPKSNTSSDAAKSLAAITSGSTDDLFSTGAVDKKKKKKTVTGIPPPPAEESVEQGEWIEAFDKKRCEILMRLCKHKMLDITHAYLVTAARGKKYYYNSITKETRWKLKK